MKQIFTLVLLFCNLLAQAGEHPYQSQIIPMSAKLKSLYPRMNTTIMQQKNYTLVTITAANWLVDYYAERPY